MIIVDQALARRLQQGNPVKVAIVGAGFSSRNIAYQIVKSVPGLRVVAIANRTLANAKEVFRLAGFDDPLVATSPNQLTDAIAANRPVVCEDPAIVCDAAGVEVVVEATGTIEFGASVVLRAIKGGKHVVLVNVELDATLGPILKHHADQAGVIYTNCDGDEPGVAMNIIRLVRSLGLTPRVAGNLKGMYDPYRTPDTQRSFAETYKQKPATMASFADGTKMSMELTVLANATGFGVAKRGMIGPALKHVNDGPSFYRDHLANGGLVDFMLGAAPNNGAFVLAYSDDPVKAAYLKYLKMGDGPLYCFYTPFHLPQMEIPNTIARAVLFKDATVAPLGAPACDSVAVAKRDLKAGETLDGLGGFTCYALVDNYRTSILEKSLPIGISESCRLKRDVPKDRVISYDDVELPAGRLCDKLRTEQNRQFPVSA